MASDRRPFRFFGAALSITPICACVVAGGGEDSPTPALAGAGSGQVDVRDLGAAGDGVTDDTGALEAALQAGVDSASSVFLPDGVYRVTRPIVVELGGGVLDLSCGASAGVIGDLTEPAQEAGIFTIDGPGTARIDGLAVYGHAEARGLIDGILVSQADRAELSRVLVTGASRWGVALDRVAGGAITSSTLDDNRYGGLGLITASDILVDGGSFSLNGTTFIEDGYGVALASSAFGPSRRVTIRGVTADGNLRKGLDVHSGHDVVIEQSSVRGFGLSGIYAVNEDAGKDVADIVIRDNVVDGMEAAQPILGIDVGAYSAAAVPSGGFQVVNNVVRNTSSPASTAILVRNPEPGGAATASVLIHHNEIWNGAGPDAYAIRTDNNAVAIGAVTVTNNYVHARAALVLIGVLASESASIRDNQLVTEGGTAAYGIIAAPPARGDISGNALTGSFDTPVALFAGQWADGNTLNGAAL
jgi:hypothetical protein